MKNITFLVAVVAGLAACKSKTAEPPTANDLPAQTSGAPTAGEVTPEAEPEPEPRPPLKPLAEVDRSCVADTDCVLTGGFTISGDSMCCATSCVSEAVNATWLAEAFKVCTENNANKATFCPPTKCEPFEVNAARCVDSACQAFKSDKPPQPLGFTK